MKQLTAILFISCLSILSINAVEKNKKMEIYKFSAQSIDGKKINLQEYKGKVILIINTASKCGFTPQYEGLEALYKKYKDQGLVILGFPCNQFGSQEPGNEEEIANFCKLKYDVTFPMFKKIDVNGDNADPIYKYLKEILPGTPGNSIKWNFTKFLIDKNGKPIKRYSSNTKPENIAEDVEELLSQK